MGNPIHHQCDTSSIILDSIPQVSYLSWRSMDVGKIGLMVRRRVERWWKVIVSSVFVSFELFHIVVIFSIVQSLHYQT